MKKIKSDNDINPMDIRNSNLKTPNINQNNNFNQPNQINTQPNNMNEINTASTNTKKKNNNKKRFFLLVALYIIFALIVLIIITIATNLIFASPKITLNGEEIIEIDVFGTYEDEGATATLNNTDISDKIIIENNLDPKVVGKYSIIYSVSNYLDRNTKSIARTIKVTDKIPPAITINGDKEKSLTAGQTYNDEGATATDNYDGDISNRIITSNNVNTAVAGTYEVIYEVSDSSGNKTTEIRTVTVKKKQVASSSSPQVTVNENTYIVVSISEQKLWFYLNGSLYLTSNVITGKKGIYDTPTGTFSIYSKATNTHLKGVDTMTGIPYDSFVNFWIPFYGGYGLHDASWQPSFGGNLYTYRGSHGCINLPYSTAQTLYYNAPIGTTVRIY